MRVVEGDLTYTQYAATKALHDGIGLMEQGHAPPKKPWNGVETTRGTLHCWTLNNKLESLHPDDVIPVSKALSDFSTAFPDDSLVSDDFNIETVIHAILDPIPADTGPGLVLNSKSSIDTTLNDSTIISGASTTRFSVAGNAVSPGAGPTFTLAWVKEKKINVKTKSIQSDNGTHNSRTIIFGTDHLSLFLSKNLVLQIAGDFHSTTDAFLVGRGLYGLS